jgi:parvulin-like peptidyl-prolyl isomerase
MRRHLSWILILASFGTIAAQEANNQLVQRLKGQPVARVNGTMLTTGDLLREMYAIFPYARTHNGFPKAMEADIRAGALKMIEFEELVFQEAQRRKMTVAPAKLDEAVKDLRKSFANEQDFQKYLSSEMNGSADRLRYCIRRSMLIDEIIKTEVTNRAAVSMADAKAYYDRNPDRFRVQESFAFQTISILPAAKPTPAQLKDVAKRANDALLKAKVTKTYTDFGLLAEKISEDDFRVNMGDHHAVARAKLPPVVDQTIVQMQPGQMSGLIPVEQAFCIVRLNSRVPAGIKPFDEIKDSLRKQLEKDKTEQLRSTLDKKLRATGKVQEL